MWAGCDQFLRRFRISQEDRDDCWQTVFLRLFETDYARLRAWRGTNLPGYIAIIAKRIAFDLLRTRKPEDPWPSGFIRRARANPAATPWASRLRWTFIRSQYVLNAPAIRHLRADSSRRECRADQRRVEDEAEQRLSRNSSDNPSAQRVPEAAWTMAFVRWRADDRLHVRGLYR